MARKISVTENSRIGTSYMYPNENINPNKTSIQYFNINSIIITTSSIYYEILNILNRISIIKKLKKLASLFIIHLKLQSEKRRIDPNHH